MIYVIQNAGLGFAVVKGIFVSLSAWRHSSRKDGTMAVQPLTRSRIFVNQ
jgi:hypothetical protein